MNDKSELERLFHQTERSFRTMFEEYTPLKPQFRQMKIRNRQMKPQFHQMKLNIRLIKKSVLAK